MESGCSNLGPNSDSQKDGGSPGSPQLTPTTDAGGSDVEEAETEESSTASTPVHSLHV